VSREGRTVPVEVSEDLARVTVDGRSFELKVVADGDGPVEIEIAKEPVKLAGWPSRCPVPPGPVEVNGESWSVAVDAAAHVPRGRAAPSAPSAVPPSRTPAAPPADGLAIVPPMPGRVVEVRVREGEAVEKGTVLLVLEAMKMRNEVVAPSAGVVRELKVREGSNVRARETMMVVAGK
jgi:biotin carboxyl carrier protein